jgi:curli biogenesis system outer membrane secretion channel CsgG
MHKSIFLYLILTIACIEITFAQDFDKTISSTADTLSKKIISSKRNTVAITDFINLDGSITQLGTFLSEEISSELSNLTNNQTAFRILERSKLDQIVKEKNLIQSTDGSKVATELGKLDVADVLIFATITDFNGIIVLL